METERNESPGGDAVEGRKPEARLLVWLCRSHSTVKIISAFGKYQLKGSHPLNLNGHAASLLQVHLFHPMQILCL